jgi:hypothetical protein
LQQALALRVSISPLTSKLHALARSSLSLGNMGDVRCPRTCTTAHVTSVTYRYWIGMTATQRRGAPHVRHFMPALHRFCLTRLRLACSDLRVVQGRRSGLDRTQRTCMVHSSFDPDHNEIEDVRHFLLECPAYEGLRLHPYFRDIFSCLHSASPHPVTTSVMIRQILMHPNQHRLAMCLSRMFNLRRLILTGQLQAGNRHHDLPNPHLHPPRSWWLLGSHEDLSFDTY